MEWFIDIIGEAEALEELAKSFTSDELCIAKKEQGFILKSADFNVLKDVKDVQGKANDIITYLNGAARLVLEMRKPLKIGGINRINDNGKKDIFVSLSDTITIQSRVGMVVVSVGADGKTQEIHPADIIPSWVMLAQNDANVAKVFRLYSTGDFRWANLYLIYEVIKGDMVGLEEIVKEHWITKSAITHFTHTANSPAASGEETRHVRGQSSPKNPMTLSEAKSFIDSIIQYWLRLKMAP